MTADGDSDTSRTVVKTYLPAYQRDEWDDHADELGMSRSEFVKAMVQAGRRGFEGVERMETGDDSSTDVSQDSPVDLRDAVLESLSEDEYRDWDELLDDVTGDVETRLEAVLDDLQAENLVRYSGRNGGYTLEG